VHELPTAAFVIFSGRILVNRHDHPYFAEIVIERLADDIVVLLKVEQLNLVAMTLALDLLEAVKGVSENLSFSVLAVDKRALK